MEHPLKFNVVILAAGQGKRMMSRLPKVLHCLAGVPMLLRVLNVTHSLQPSPEKIVVVVGHGSDVVKSALPEGTLTVVQDQQKGTGHAVMQALPLLNDGLATLVLCGDVPCIQVTDLHALLNKAHLNVSNLDEPNNHTNTMVVLTAKPADPTGYGRMDIRLDGTVERIIEHKDCTPEQRDKLVEVNTGVMLLPAGKAKQWLAQLQPNNAQGEYYLTDCVALANRENITVQRVEAENAWTTEGVNSRVQLAVLERLHQRSVAEHLMIQGVSLADPARIDVRGHLSCDSDVSIDIGCVFEGTVAIASGVSIGAYCVLKNCTIEQNVQILPFTHIDGACIGANSRIGPYARLRPGTVLSNDCHIGNFVELKNTQVAAHSKANHLAYIGDAVVGSQVNIGAGVITCNYDGANKYQTVIEDGAFIGSDVQLIAPVTVGSGATIAAGTTVTKNAPAKQLTVGRVKQTSIAHWQRPVKR
jgi:bifunctional UDP-N-acetylglucosamine pyrophosphorylase / glucosamine-1-phosphate N-acetyltransferase